MSRKPGRKHFASDSHRVSAVEYVLISALIAVSAITTVQNISRELNGIFTNVEKENEGPVARD